MRFKLGRTKKFTEAKDKWDRYNVEVDIAISGGGSLCFGMMRRGIQPATAASFST